jgi:PAS domain S-box-containing protein
VVVVVSGLAVLASITQWAAGGRSLNEHLLLLQTFMGTMSVASLVLGAATAQRWRAEDSLRESEARLKLALEAGRMGTWEWDIASGRVSWSPGLEAIHGMAAGTFPGTFDAVLAAALPEDRARLRQSVARALEERSEHHIEYRIVVPRGKVRWLEGRGRVVLGPHGAPIRMVGVCMDVTERKQAEEALERSNADLEDFAHAASHDLKEPLRGITHLTRFLLADYGERLDEEGRQRLETLGALSERLGRQITALLEFSRVGRTELAVDEADLGALAEEALSPLAVRIEQEGAQVRVGRLPRVRCDRVRIAQVFANLVSNGLKYNQSRPKVVEVGCLPGPGPAVLYVRDNGIGIGPKDRDRVFRIFTRLPGGEALGGGSGAGLAIVKSIVERHGGRVWIESEPGRGATFYFTLEPGVAGAPVGAGAAAGAAD